MSMTERSWEFRLDEIQHVVELEHGYFSGERSIRVDVRVLPMSHVELRWCLCESCFCMLPRQDE
jgi:hypothetical protein